MLARIGEETILFFVVLFIGIGFLIGITAWFKQRERRLELLESAIRDPNLDAPTKHELVRGIERADPTWKARIVPPADGYERRCSRSAGSRCSSVSALCRLAAVTTRRRVASLRWSASRSWHCRSRCARWRVARPSRRDSVPVNQSP